MSHSLDQNSTGHHNAVKGSEVFVGGLSRATTENKISEAFSSCGDILELRLIKDRKGNSKGYCFIRFATKEGADKAVKEKSGTMLDGKDIGVLPSIEQDSLYLGNLHKEWDADEFDKIVRQAFTDIVSVDLAMPFSGGDGHPSRKQKNRGFAFVKFSSHAAAARAFRLGSGSDFLLASFCHPVVQWAELEPEIDPEELAKVKIAFVRNIPPDADENYLEKLFAPFGKVDRVVVSKKSRTPVGFVHFVDRSDLDKAIKEMNGKPVQGPNGGSSFDLLVEVARPIEKNKKRTRDDPQIRQPRKVLTRPASKDEPIVTFGGTKYATQDHKYLIEEPLVADPYEAAVVSLPVTVKERLLRILRLGIATRFDIGIHCLTSLKELPESSAISVLDQFMLSGADKHDKAEYLAGLISRHQVDKLGPSSHSLNYSRMVDTESKESQLSSFCGRVYLPADSLASRVHLPAVDAVASRVHLSAVDSLANRALLPAVDSLPSRKNLPAVDSLSSHAGANLARYDTYTDPYASLTETYSSRYSSSLSSQPLLSRIGIGRMDEISPTSLHQTPGSSSSYSRIGLYSSSLTSSADHQPTRSRIRFDPYTGEPYKFDPFTGEPIALGSLTHHPPSPY